ncbi:MAG: ASPIC/UnbV domain-containing protein [Candidatus Acidiferrales bacterium]
MTFGLGQRDAIERVVIEWPSGRVEDYKDLAAGHTYQCIESKGITQNHGF